MTALASFASRIDVLEVLVRSVARATLSDPIAPGRLNPAPSDTRIDDAGLGLDSLDRWRFVAHIVELTHIDETGGEEYLFLADTIAAAAQTLSQLLTMTSSARFSFRSSGTTSSETMTTHDFSFLRRESRAVQSLFSADEIKTIGLWSPAHHLFGFQNGLLMAIETGSRLIDIGEEGASVRKDRIADCDLLVATPAHFERLVTAARHAPMPCPPICVSSGFPLSPRLYDGLSALGVSRIVELYGATQTAAMGWREQSDAPFQLLPHLARKDDAVIDAHDRHEIRPQDKLDWRTEHDFDIGPRLDLTCNIAGRQVDLAGLIARVKGIVSDRDWVIFVARDDATERPSIFISDQTDQPSYDDGALTLVRHVRAELDGCGVSAFRRFSVAAQDLKAFQSGKPGRIIRA